jgi:hypothetical protein
MSYREAARYLGTEHVNKGDIPQTEEEYLMFMLYSLAMGTFSPIKEYL